MGTAVELGHQVTIRGPCGVEVLVGHIEQAVSGLMITVPVRWLRPPDSLRDWD
jgi:hypothetical protein